MQIFIVRHAHAGQAGDPKYPDDSQRPLTGEGRARFQALLRGLDPSRFAPEVIATSPMVRCRQTAELISKGACTGAKAEELSALLPGSKLSDLLKWTKVQQASSVAWVGHAPDVDLLAAALIGCDAAGLRFAKGAIAAVEFDELPAAGAGQLRWFISPKVLAT